MKIDDSLNISTRLRKADGASVFGGKFRYTTVLIHKDAGRHTLYAAGINGKLKYLYAIDDKGNKIAASYSTAAPCRAWVVLENGIKHCYFINCNDVPALIQRTANHVNYKINW